MMMSKRGMKARWGTGADELRMPDYDEEHAERIRRRPIHESAAAKALRAFADKVVDKSLGNAVQRVRERIRGLTPKTPKIPKIISAGATGAVITCAVAGCG